MSRNCFVRKLSRLVAFIVDTLKAIFNLSSAPECSGQEAALL